MTTLYTAKITTSGPTNVSHTFRANSDSLAILEARRVLAKTQERVPAQLDKIWRHDGVPATAVEIS